MSCELRTKWSDGQEAKLYKIERVNSVHAISPDGIMLSDLGSAGLFGDPE
jgi:hypothetical protein